MAQSSKRAHGRQPQRGAKSHCEADRSTICVEARDGGPAVATEIMAKPFILLRLLGCATTVIDLVSPLRRADCVGELRAHVDDPWNLTGLRPIIGWIGPTSFSLRRRLGYRNSFRTVLRGTFVEESQQTRVHCRIGISPFVRAIMLINLASIALCGCVIAGTAAVGLLPSSTASTATVPLIAVVVPLFMLCFCIALLAGGRYLARGQDHELVEFLTERLKAHVVPAPDA